jgi:hypothetical protein
MIFVNRIAGVVHACVNEFFGSPSQNVGDAFLLVWVLSGHEKSKQQRLADCATISFMKTIALISKSELLAEYRYNSDLLKLLPDYRVRMGFGLHTGWAIEGAIGSEFKIDASYLSPNVSMAARLQGFTKVYDNTIIISDALVQLMTPPVAEYCRQIDNVALLDSDPFKMYTIDLDDACLIAELGDTTSGRQYSGNSRSSRESFKPATKKQYCKDRLERKLRMAERWRDDFNIMQMLSQDKDMKRMRKIFTKEFFEIYKQALAHYVAGEWPEAIPLLEKTRFYNEVEDGPSATLLRFMNMNDNQAPEGWPGYHSYLDA